MKELFINLQLFADESVETSQNDVNKTIDNKEQEQGQENEKAPTAKLKNPDEPKYTDKDVDEILNRKFAKWQEKQQKAVDEAKKLSAMNAQQKAEYERDKLQKELDEYKRRASLAEMSKTARKNA